MSWKRQRPSASLVISVIALVIAVGGAGVFAIAGHHPSSGKIVGYALVKPNGDVVGKHSLNVRDSNLVPAGTYAYCFRNLPFNFQGAVATVDYGSTGNDYNQNPSVQFLRGNAPDCPPEQAEVVTSTKNGLTGLGFYVEFYK